MDSLISALLQHHEEGFVIIIAISDGSSFCLTVDPWHLAKVCWPITTISVCIFFTTQILCMCTINPQHITQKTNIVLGLLKYTVCTGHTWDWIYSLDLWLYSVILLTSKDGPFKWETCISSSLNAGQFVVPLIWAIAFSCEAYVHGLGNIDLAISVLDLPCQIFFN